MGEALLGRTSRPLRLSSQQLLWTGRTNKTPEDSNNAPTKERGKVQAGSNKLQANLTAKCLLQDGQWSNNQKTRDCHGRSDRKAAKGLFQWKKHRISPHQPPQHDATIQAEKDGKPHPLHWFQEGIRQHRPHLHQLHPQDPQLRNILQKMGPSILPEERDIPTPARPHGGKDPPRARSPPRRHT